MEADGDLTQYGGEGWELVAVVPCAGDPGIVVAHLKRPC
jgi:hypothetical protein